MKKSKKENKFEKLIKAACKNYEKKLYIKKKKTLNILKNTMNNINFTNITNFSQSFYLKVLVLKMIQVVE